MARPRKLYYRLKPEMKHNLEQQRAKYKYSVDEILDTLATKKFYTELTMGEISSLHVFSHYEITQVSSFDLRWGEHMFNNK